MFNKFPHMVIRAFAVFMSMLVLAVLLVSTSYLYMDNVYQKKQSATNAMRIWQRKINNSVESNQVIDEFESNFIKLVNQGVVGAEARLSWFETIQNTAKKRGMPSVKYSIATQERLKERNLKTEYKGINVYKSVMTLDIQMAHEGDLFALLNDLKKADGLYTVDKCSINKISNISVDKNNNMKAFCQLGWYTFRGEKADKNRGKSG